MKPITCPGATFPACRAPAAGTTKPAVVPRCGLLPPVGGSIKTLSNLVLEFAEAESKNHLAQMCVDRGC